MANRSAHKIKLSPVNDLFDTDEKILEKTVSIEIKKLKTFENHPFKVADNEDMLSLISSIRDNGVIVPIIVREIKKDEYEIISGHRRVFACDFLKLETIPSIVKKLSDEESVITMVDSNIQREKLLFSEKAFAYKMRFDAIKKQAGRNKNDSLTEDKKLSTEIIADDTGESGRQIQRYICLTSLIPEFLEKVDAKELAFTSAVEISFLNHDLQKILLTVIEETKKIPSFVQAKLIKETLLNKLSNNETFDAKEFVLSVLSDAKTPPPKVVLTNKKLCDYFPKDYSAKQMEEVIFSLLQNWKDNS